MRIIMSFLVLFLIGYAGEASSASSIKYEFSVTCDLNEDHGNDPDRHSYDEEKELVERALSTTFAKLPRKLKNVVTKVGIVVSHKYPQYSKKYMGWSAEDDPEYRYPDKTFYHPIHAPQGTIRVIVTEKFVQTLALGYELGETSPLLQEAIDIFTSMIIGHELMHAWQYHQKPVRDINNFPDLVVDGIVEPDLLHEQKIKLKYESDALGIEPKFTAGHIRALSAFADAIDAQEKKNPEDFLNSGRFSLLASTAPNPLANYYFRGAVLALEKPSTKFAGGTDVTYNGQIIPPQIVARLNEINNKLEKDGRAVPPTNEIAQLKATWTKYMEVPETESLKETFTYLLAVEKRYHKEVERLSRLTASR